MSYKTIEYTVFDDKIMPNTLQAGGVAGDDNAVRVKFDLNNITLAADDKVRIEISNGVGGFNSSEHLTVANGCVYYDLPFDVTSAGGTAVLHLVICSCKDNVEQAVRYSYPAKIYFEESGCGSISYKQYKQGLSGLALECKSYSDDAKNAADEAEIAVAETNQSASSAQSSKAAAQEAAAAAKTSADSAADAVSEHNNADDAHSAKFAEINNQLSLMAPITALSAAIDAHNTDTAAHGDIRDKIALIQKYPCYEYATSGGAVQRFDDVSVIPHNIGVTVYGATKYSKNLIPFPYVGASNDVYTVNDDGRIYVNGTYDSPKNFTVVKNADGSRIKLEKNTNYYFSCSNNNVNLALTYYVGETKQSIYSNTKFCPSEDTECYIMLWTKNGYSYENELVEFQLEKGSAATPYEPYYEPKNVTNPTVSVYGKNLCPINRVEDSKLGMLNAVIKKGVTYTFSCLETYTEKGDDPSITTGGEFKINGTSLGQIWLFKDVKRSFTFVAPEDGALTLNMFNYVTLEEIQLEVGDTATEYEPYTEPQTVTVPMSFSDGESVNLTTFNAVSPTMTVIATDDNALVSVVDVTYNRDIGKALGNLQAAIAAHGIS